MIIYIPPCDLIDKVLPGYKLVQAEGYTYFQGNDCANWKKTETGYPKAWGRTPEQWLITLKRMIKDNSPCPLISCKKRKR
jgi:hypothetical protein